MERQRGRERQRERQRAEQEREIMREVDGEERKRDSAIEKGRERESESGKK